MGQTRNAQPSIQTLRAIFKNPLAGISRAKLLRNVEIVSNEKQLTEELPILSKGAICEFIQRHTTSFTRSHHPAALLVAQSPADFETLNVLDDCDKDIIRYEYAHRWSHPVMLYVTIVLCSIGAATQ